MRLRTQLMLAFLLLAVVPLGAITLYSYESSARALRRTVETESARLAEEMNQRMTVVTAGLSQRIDRLETLPFPEVATGAPAEAHDPALVGRMIAALGDAADYIEEFELTPAPPTPPDAAESSSATRVGPMANRGGAPPSSGRPGRMPVVIQLPRIVGDIAKDPKLASTMQLAARFIPPEAAQKLEKELQEKLGQNAHEIVRVVQEQIQAAARTKEDDASPPAPVAALTLKQEFGCPLTRDGRTVGHLKAKVSTDRLLRAILSQTRREQGEIPFAIDANGTLFTPDPADAPTLRGLERAAASGQIDALGKQSQGGAAPTSRPIESAGDVGDPHAGDQKMRVDLRPDDNWVVVTREDPATGLMLGIARPVGKALGEIRRASARNLGAGLGLAALALFGVVPISRRMTHNLSDLTRAAGEIAAGRLDTQVPERSRDELGRLAVAFNRMARDLAANQERLVEQERLRKELELCRRIQSELLPKKPLSYPFADVQGLSIPAHELGGDFFNYFDLPGGAVALIVGDVSGKGVPAALLMANLQATLRARMPLEADLASFAVRLDREVEASTPPEVYLTLFLGVLDPARRELRYVNAGHEPPFLLRGGGRLERLDPSGRPIGLMPGGGYVERRVSLEAGDRLVLYTDGLVEAESPSGVAFGAERLQELLAGDSAVGSPDLLARIERAYQEYRGPGEAADDATLLVLRVGNWPALRDAANLWAGIATEPGPPPTEHTI